MISVKEALQIILNNTQDFGVEEIPFLESVGRILKENIEADRDFPPFNRVSMDGIAINQNYFLAGNRNFPIEGIQAAGAKQKVLMVDSNSMEVMTGAVLPENTDTVIRILIAPSTSSLSHKPSEEPRSSQTLPIDC